jgi:hypothetical protein
MRALLATAAAFVVAIGVGVCTYDSAVRAASDSSPFPQAMVGAWNGTADIAVNWTIARALPVRLQIAQDGSVSGTVGDATVRNGRLQRNRTTLGRTLHVKTDWIVVGALEGDVIKAESIHRDGVKIPLNWFGDHFEGSVNTSGSQFGGAESMWLAALHLRLDRSRR